MESATAFLVNEFEVPMDTVSEWDGAMYEYRTELIKVAYYILGGAEDGKHNLPESEIEEKDES